MRCIEYNDDYKDKWVDFTIKNDQATIYHDILWKTILEKSFCLKSHYLICLDDSGEIAGILPMFEMKDIFRRLYLVSIPFFTNAGLCATRKETTDILLEKTKEIANDLKAQYVELRHLAIQSINGLKSRNVFTTSIVKLSRDENAVWKSSFSDSAQRNIRKAKRSNLSVAMGNDSLDGFYKVYSNNMRDLGTPPMPLIFFKNILAAFSDKANILTVKKNNKIIAGMLLIKYKGTLYDPFVSSLKKYNPLRPNNLLYWEAIKFGCRNGFSYFDLGRSTAGTGLFDFKAQWGAYAEPLSYQYIFNKSSQIPICDAVNNKYGLAIEIWKRMPVFITNYIGPKLIPHLPEL